jgi:cobalt transport protein
MKRSWWYALAIAAVGLILVAPMVIYQGEDMQGADDAGSDQTGADPWFENVFNPPEGSEPILFALVAIAGILVIAFIMYRTRKTPGDGGKR